jgi:hypothetical protein
VGGDYIFAGADRVATDWMWSEPVVSLVVPTSQSPAETRAAVGLELSTQRESLTHVLGRIPPFTLIASFLI